MPPEGGMPSVRGLQQFSLNITKTLALFQTPSATRPGMLNSRPYPT